MQNFVDIQPEYFGKNIIRYENFLSDINILMTDEELHWSVTEALSYLIKKYELINFCYFNRDAYNFLFETFWTYYKKYLYIVNEKEALSGIEEDDMSLLLSLKTQHGAD
jgi:hypothetical protein